MNLARIDLNLFVIFDIIYREQSLTRAAKRLHLSQPAVSHALARLREQFNDPLFERAGAGMAPTPLARTLIEPVRAALAQLETTLNQEQEFVPAQCTRHFTLGARDMMESTALPRLMARLGNDAPKMQIRSLRVARKELPKALLQGKLDLAADVLLPVGEEIAYEKIASEKLLVALRPGHALLQKAWSGASYVKAQHVQVSSRLEGMGLEDVPLQKAGLVRHVALRCQNYHAAAAVVAQTDLVLTLPENFARALTGVELRPFPFAMDPIELYLYWPKKASTDSALIWLKDQLLTQFKG